MVASYEKMALAPRSLELSLKDYVIFWDNNRLLTPYSCPEFMFIM